MYGSFSSSILIIPVTKNALLTPLPWGLNARSLGADHEALDAEVTGDMVAQTLMDGLADGTLILSDSDLISIEDGECTNRLLYPTY